MQTTAPHSRLGPNKIDSSASSDAAVDLGRALHAECGAVICISGETDYTIGRSGVIRGRNGHIMMTRVTGLGCTASALCGAFAAVASDPTVAAAGGDGRHGDRR